jgi:carbamoyl-phosphate synthase small subunit
MPSISTPSTLANLLAPKNPPAILALADGTVFIGQSIGFAGHTTGEVVFNTSMTGYQEILTDPSYCQQIVTLTYPHIGNYGTNPEDVESNQVYAAGLIIKDLPLVASNFRSTKTLSQYLIDSKTVAISNIDTRQLTRHLRTHGAQNGCIMGLAEGETATQAKIDEAIAAAKAVPSMAGLDLAKVVSTKESYQWTEAEWQLKGVANNWGQTPIGSQERSDEKQLGSDPNWLAAHTKQAKFKVIAYDFGIKQNILRMLTSRGCQVTVVPAQTPASEVLAMNPQGVFLSNGPGDPEPCTYAIEAAKAVMAKGIPLFGICLGHQIMALASGAKTFKMKFGHHGANHPVKDLDTGHVGITSQNHGFAVDEKTLPANLKPTHISLFDGTLQGIERTDTPAFSFQGHPEASPGPQDIGTLFDKFIAMMASKN